MKREKKKKHMGERDESCTLMGEQIPCKLVASRQEFNAALVDSQTLVGDEGKKKKTREIGENRWRGME